MELLLFYYGFISVLAAGGMYSDLKSDNPMPIDYLIYGIIIIIFPIVFPFILGEYIAEKTSFF